MTGRIYVSAPPPENRAKSTAANVKALGKFYRDLMNGDTLEVMKAISDARAEMLKAVGDLHQEFSGFKGSMEARVGTIETEQDDAKKRQWYHSIIVGIGTIVHHDLSSIFHWKL